ncbi:MAG: hypothetical protein PF904_00205 [Kiritimatiellae bacterium]|nr:hypothetical protein [Kiritimatiellia bacterium]
MAGLDLLAADDAVGALGDPAIVPEFGIVVTDGDKVFAVAADCDRRWGVRAHGAKIEQCGLSLHNFTFPVVLVSDIP